MYLPSMMNDGVTNHNVYVIIKYKGPITTRLRLRMLVLLAHAHRKINWWTNWSVTLVVGYDLVEDDVINYVAFTIFPRRIRSLRLSSVLIRKI